MNDTKIPALFDHQKQSVVFFEAINTGLDFSDQGTGKTRVQIELFAKHRRMGGGKGLFVVPKSIMDVAWKADFYKYAPDITVQVCDAKNRDSKFAVEADAYVINTDAVKWAAGLPKAAFSAFDWLVIDELTCFKDHQSLRSKAAKKLSTLFTHRYGLTGTPTANGLLDIWGQVLVIDGGKRLGNLFYKFRDYTHTPKQVGAIPQAVEWVEKEDARLFVTHLLKDIMIRHERASCLSLPDNFTYTLDFELSKSQRKAYDELEAQMVLLINEQPEVVALNAVSLLGKLLQISSGAVYDISGNAKIIDTVRYEAAIELMSKREGTVCFFQWTHQRNQIEAMLKAANIPYGVIDGSVSMSDRKAAVDRFQIGIDRVILCHPQSAAHGITLTKGTTTLWLNPTYNLEHFLQGNARIHRAGQTKKTETIVLIAKDTVEERVYKRLMEKDGAQNTLFSLIKEIVCKS